MTKRKQKTIKKVALAAILSLFLTSAASTITVNAIENNQTNLNVANNSDEKTIAEAADTIRKFFTTLYELDTTTPTNAKDRNTQEEQIRNKNAMITAMIQAQQARLNIWGPIFLLNRLGLLQAVKITQHKGQNLGDALTKQLKQEIETTQQLYDKGKTVLNKKDLSDDAKLISELRGAGTEQLAKTQLTIDIFKPDNKGRYKTQNELKPLTEQAQKLTKTMSLWLQIIKQLTINNLTDQQKEQILGLELAYNNALSNPIENKTDKTNKTGNKEEEQTQNILETITQIQANTITKIMIDLGIYNEDQKLPYPNIDINKLKESIKPTN